MESHDDLGGVYIPRSKITNSTRLASRLRGRARGWNLPIFSHLFSTSISLSTQMGWEFTYGPWSLTFDTSKNVDCRKVE